MTENIHIFIEYKVKEAAVSEYEQYMKKVLQALRDYEASEIEWFVASDQGNLYIEMFKLPTKSHYYALKKLRLDEEHHLFGKLLSFIEGGAKKVNSWAFIKKS